ncbi:MAG: Asp-tRNA(Asn)/Glu-tRNA(Gln) amidotransferase subunit GatA [SAR202 cluster bacterium]|nr:Asp-tRNA(Asn)/Glu-tRNA(Gln) amidotransferase subunit GatA [SAR202 cluster bacterium]|tara:strand:- start:20160 stop:21620 length:1461 start_codon:yes stop_codon:yes gene_type:complete
MTLPLYELTIHDAKDLLDNQMVSSEDLTRAALDRIKQVEPSIKSFVTVTGDLALEEAKSFDQNPGVLPSSNLRGIPFQLKDNICTQDILTTCSSNMLSEFIPPYDATVVEKLKHSGGIIVGKGNMDEFAMGSSTENSAFHPTHNPWDLERVPGGSSGGPAAAVASGECFYSLGSDTGGSIRQPASLCGVVGLKPTYGLVSRYGLVAFASSLDQIGPITKDVRDCSIVLDAIVGHDPMDSTSIATVSNCYSKSLKGDVNGLKIGVPKEYFEAGVDKSVLDCIKESLLAFEKLGATVSEISLPLTKYALAVYYILAPSEASANLSRYDGVKYGYSYKDAGSIWDAMEKTRQNGFGPEVSRRIMLGTYALSAGYYDAYYVKAQKVRTMIRDEFSSVFNDYDVLITPTSPSTAFLIGEKTEDPLQMYLNDICTIPANIAGIPAISIPAGFSNGLPIGMQIMGNYFSENTILNAAYAFEQATEWHKMRPSL